MEPSKTSSPAAPELPGNGVVAGPKASSGPIKPGRPFGFGGLLRTAVPSKLEQKAPAASKLPDISETGELGLGMMMQAAIAPVAPGGDEQPPLELVAEKAEAAPELPAEGEVGPPAAHVEEETVDKDAPSEVRSRPAPVPMTSMMHPPSPMAPVTPGGTLQKMKDQGFYRQQYFKEAQCFDCGQKFKVNRSSRSANCTSCGAFISLEDVDLNLPSTQPIKTRGDVIIRKRGQLSAAYLYARDLRCQGLVSANIHCSGDAIFRTTGKIVGEVHCRRFIVEKGSEITFMNPVHAEEVEIHSPITGNVFSQGPVLISANGAVNGDVTARSVSIEPGGELNGAMNIVRSSPPASPR